MIANTDNKLKNFNTVINSFTKLTQLIVSSDMCLLALNWNTLCCSDDYEKSVFDLFDHHLLRQIVAYPTCPNNAIDLVLHKN